MQDVKQRYPKHVLHSKCHTSTILVKQHTTGDAKDT